MSREYVLKGFRPPVDLRIDYPGELNPQQLAAVTAPAGPALVIAGAGAGKTRTLIYRVAFLLEQGIPPERILLLTFTNKAAREMMQRVGDLLGGDLSELWGGTFHSIGHRTLRRHADCLGYAKDFTILDREDAEDLVAACLGEADVDVAAVRFPKADLLADVFSMVVNTGRSLAQTLQEDFAQLEELLEPIQKIQELYQRRKKDTGVMDFDDLLVLWLQLLQEQETVRELYQRRFQFVLVDEYQDTNRVQADIVDRLVEKHHNIMAVGDDSQSIYSWRGADFQNILRFPERHPKTVVYKIETNYRSTPEILTLANAAIASNRQQFIKQLVPVRNAGPQPVEVVCGNSLEQAGFVAQRALELREEGVSLRDIAVLYRSHFHAMELQLELTRRGIPFSITSGLRFFEQAHIKDVAAYLRLVSNRRDELAFKRLVRLLPGIGDKSAAKLWATFHASGGGSPPPLAVALQACAGQVSSKTKVAWAQFCATMSQLEGVGKKPSDMIQLVLEADYEDYLQKAFSNYRNRLEDLQQLAVFARRFEAVEEFLAQLALQTNLETEDSKSQQGDAEMLKLSTIHQAKGLEFEVVFVIMLCEGLFPSARSVDDPETEEEERRLFYVAVTRAKTELYLTHPLVRGMPGSGADFAQRPSRFLRELPKTVREEWHLSLT